MKVAEGTEKESPPLHDYGKALRTAVSWLGDRYLLAEPVARRRPEATYYFEPRSWHETARRPAS